MFYVGQAEELVAFTYKVKDMRRLSEGTQFVSFFNKNNVNEIDRENNVAKIPFPVSSGRNARTTTLKYYSAYFLRK